MYKISKSVHSVGFMLHCIEAVLQNKHFYKTIIFQSVTLILRVPFRKVTYQKTRDAPIVMFWADSDLLLFFFGKCDQLMPIYANFDFLSFTAYTKNFYPKVYPKLQ